jgi:hypothetical protein
MLSVLDSLNWSLQIFASRSLGPFRTYCCLGPCLKCGCSHCIGIIRGTSGTQTRHDQHDLSGRWCTGSFTFSTVVYQALQDHCQCRRMSRQCRSRWSWAFQMQRINLRVGLNLNDESHQRSVNTLEGDPPTCGTPLVETRVSVLALETFPRHMRPAHMRRICADVRC